jgi:membrane-bound lytic murein transglycosylase D
LFKCSNLSTLIVCALIGCELLWPNEGSCSSSCPGAHFATLSDGFRYGLPPQIDKGNLVIAKTTVPIHRKDVRDRIIKEINYLLQDRRSRVLVWLARADSYRPIMEKILKKYDLPVEYLYLAAIESSYNSRALSSAGAYGYWQFIKSTAVCGPSGCPQYDWKMNITDWKDERADLVNSTHSAAKYLAWLNRVKKVNLNGRPERDGFNDWLLTTAAYNAGPTRIVERLNSFGASSYWDVPLPVETEKYVPRWIALWLISKHRDFYDVKTPARGTVAFDTIEKVRLQKDLSFAAIATLLDTTPRAIWSLNTEISPEKGVFPAKSGRRAVEHRINIPRGTRGKLLAQLAAHGYTKK